MSVTPSSPSDRVPAAGIVPRGRLAMVRYGMAVALAATALGLKVSLFSTLGASFPFLILYTSIVLGAWFGGLGPGILTTLLTAAIAIVLLRYRIKPIQLSREIIGIGVFVTEGTLVSLLSAARTRALIDKSTLLVRERASRERADVVNAQREQSDRALAQVAARSAATLENALDCVVSMDHHGNVVDWNPTSERTFGYTRSDALGRPMAELIIPPKYRDAHRAGLVRYLATGEGPIVGKRLEITAVRKDGVEIPVELSICRIPTDGPPLFTGFLRDITDRKNAETERERLLASERSARADAEQSSRAKDEFLATLSHELRTPLNAILGWSQLLKLGGNSSQDLAEGLAVIDRNARAQTQLIEDLLDMSRITAGKVRLDVQQVSLPGVIEAAVEAVQPAADAKGLRLTTVLDPAAGPISGDPNRLQQVIWNLLSNSMKFTPRGGRVTVTLARVNSHIEISVADTGQGIAADFLPHVFERFRQADASTTRQFGGLGLGLAIVKQLVELHGGTITAASDGPGQGATFHINLPLAPVHQTPGAAPRAHPATATDAPTAFAPQSLAGLRLLVVDDDADARELLRRIFQECQAEVFTANSAGQARQVIEQHQPHALVSDVGMPGEDGCQLVQSLRQLDKEHGGHIPAIALTALARSEDRTRSLRAGFDMHIAKPVEPSELVAAVARLVGRGN